MAYSSFKSRIERLEKRTVTPKAVDLPFRFDPTTGQLFNAVTPAIFAEMAELQQAALVKQCAAFADDLAEVEVTKATGFEVAVAPKIEKVKQDGFVVERRIEGQVKWHSTRT
jgi:hypothetical protein